MWHATNQGTPHSTFVPVPLDFISFHIRGVKTKSRMNARSGRRSWPCWLNPL